MAYTTAFIDIVDPEPFSGSFGRRARKQDRDAAFRTMPGDSIHTLTRAAWQRDQHPMDLYRGP